MESLQMKKLLGVLTFAFLTSGVALAQTDDRYTLTATDAQGLSGTQVAVNVLLDSEPGTLGAPANLQGWSFGLCHDPAALTLNSVVNGPITATVNGGSPPAFPSINTNPTPGTGFAVGVVIDFFGVNQLAPGTGYHIYTANYTLVGANGTSATLDFCDTLATPAVETLVVLQGGSSAVPVTVSGTITIGSPPVGNYSLVASDEVGAPGTSATVEITMDNPEAAEGFSFGLLHDNAVAQLTAINEGAASAATNGGSGADFFFGNIAPALPAGASGGGFVGAVISLSPPFDAIPLGTDQVIATFVYSLGGASGTMTDVVFSDQVGNPPVATVISVNGGAEVPATTDGSIEVVGIAVPNFIRGDANDDGELNVSDVVFLAKWLFGVGPTGTCDSAGDVNDNGVLDAIADPMFLLTYLFQSGPAPAAPGLVCGPDGTPDSLTCGPVASCP